jgi:hypothetical protein
MRLDQQEVVDQVVVVVQLAPVRLVKAIMVVEHFNPLAAVAPVLLVKLLLTILLGVMVVQDSIGFR